MERITLKVKQQQPIDNLLPDTRCLAILIDLVSNIYHVTQLRPELYYWQQRVCQETATAPQLGMFLSRLIEALQLIQFEEQLANVTINLVGHRGLPLNKRHQISGPSLRAANAIFQCYEVSWKKAKPGTPAPHPHQIAGIIDTVTRMYRAVRLLPLVKAKKQELAQGKLTIQDVADFFKHIGVELEYLPTWKEREEEAKIVLA